MCISIDVCSPIHELAELGADKTFSWGDVGGKIQAFL